MFQPSQLEVVKYANKTSVSSDIFCGELCNSWKVAVNSSCVANLHSILGKLVYSKHIAAFQSIIRKLDMPGVPLISMDQVMHISHEQGSKGRSCYTKCNPNFWLPSCGRTTASTSTSDLLFEQGSFDKEFVWVSQVKRMYQIEWIDFETCIFSPLLEGAHPPQTPPVLSLIWGPKF